MKTKSIVLWSVLAAVVLLLLSWNRIFPQKPAPVVSDPASLPGIQMGTAPWAPEVTNLLARLRAIGLPALTEEGNVLHIHQHLDLVINGQKITVPAGIGINEAAGFISPLHAHDTSGIIHVESDVVRDFTLGEFFDIWGVRLTNDCVGGYCNTGSSTLKLFSNGEPYTGNPRDLVLTPHQEIMMVYGTSTPATITASYVFPAGY